MGADGSRWKQMGVGWEWVRVGCSQVGVGWDRLGLGGIEMGWEWDRGEIGWEQMGTCESGMGSGETG